MDKQKVKQTSVDWLKDNRLAMLYPILAIIMEMTAVFAIEGSPFLTRPFLSLGVMVFFFALLLLIKDNRIRLVVGACMLIVQAVLDLVFAALFDMTGQYFDWGMLSLRNDAVAALEKIPINFFAFYGGVLCCVVYIIYGLRSLRDENGVKVKRAKRSAWFYVGLAAIGIATTVGSYNVYYPATTDKYDEMINGKSSGAYSAYGMIGNLISEVAGVLRPSETKLTQEEAEAFFYAKESVPSPYFGVSKDKNVVMLLSESFEWYAFMRNDKEYPNVLPFTQQELAALYPNLTQFYNESVVATNYYSREKTDISETLSILGSYPTDAYVNYDYYQNEMPHTVPNLLKTLDSDIQALSFHNGFKTFYNRDKVHLTFGFDKEMTDMYDMAEMAKAAVEEAALRGEEIEPTFTNHEDNGELNLDSEMIETCKDMMFPTDKRFYTYITSITMHGVYYERENLADVRKQVEEVLGDRKPEEEEEKADALFHYMVTAKEFDNALGLMRKDLEEKGLWENTVIVLFGDHNAYYQELSNYVKDIPNYDTENKFTDLYKVPLMIHDVDLSAKVEKKKIDKFACTSDLVPTLLDLLGIKYYSNMYYGNSLFNEQESVLYSRAYDIFLREGIVGKSANNIIYDHYLTENDLQGDIDDAIGQLGDRYMHSSQHLALTEAFRRDATALVEKIKYCDYIFEKDYFGNEKNYNHFVVKMHKLNGLA